MGSMGSRPKVSSPQQVQYIYVPAEPVYAPPPASTPSVPTPAVTAPVTPATNTEGEQSESKGGDTDTARTSGLQERKRGTASTILTGFRGVLTQTAKPDQRKTLLGE